METTDPSSSTGSTATAVQFKAAVPADTTGEALLRPFIAGRILGVDRRTLLRYLDKGLLDSIPTAGGHNRYKESQVRALRASKARAAVSG